MCGRSFGEGRGTISRRGFERNGVFSTVKEKRLSYNPSMPLIKASFHRLPEKKKWYWRVGLILFAVLNVWEWFHDVALGRTLFAIGDAVFALLILCVIIASFLDRGKSAIQGR